MSRLQGVPSSAIALPCRVEGAAGPHTCTRTHNLIQTRAQPTCRGRRTRSTAQTGPSEPQFPRPQGPHIPPPEARHSQYLMTAMLTGAVQVTTSTGSSEAMAEKQRDPSSRQQAFPTRAAASLAIGPRRPTCSRAAQSAAGPVHAPPPSQ